MENVDLKDIEDGRNLELARDLFMIGVWTAQRVSDYNNIGRTIFIRLLTETRSFRL